MDRIIVQAPATVGNIGPGFDILGMAVEGLEDEFELQESHKKDQIITVSGRDAELIPREPRLNTVTIAAQFLLDKFSVNRSFSVHIQRNLPVSGGLGASAAASIAGAYGVAKLFNLQVTDQMLLQAALVGEGVVSGRHLDNIAPCFFGGVALVRNLDPPKVHRFTCQEYWISLVNPAQKLNTKDSRQVLPKTMASDVWVKQMARCVALVQGLTTGNDDLIRESVEDSYAEPYRAPLIHGFILAKANALAAGALGCSISGGGPTCFAISATKDIAVGVQKAMEAGFAKVAVSHVGRIGNRGIRVKEL